MSDMRCFDFASMVIDEANEKYADSFELNKERLCGFKKCCEVVDNIIDEFDIESIDTTVLDNKMISVTIESDDFSVDRNDHECYELFKTALWYKFFQTNNGKIGIEFVFNSLWDKL